MERYASVGPHVHYSGLQAAQPTGIYTPRIPAHLSHQGLPAQPALGHPLRGQHAQPILHRLSSNLHQPILRRMSSQHLVRRFSQTMQGTVSNALHLAVTTFLCPICLENVRTDQRVVFSSCGDDAHGCCAECTKFFIKGLVDDGRVNNITCGQRGGTDCRASATTEEVKKLTDDGTYQKYLRFKMMRDDPHVRECPTCKELNTATIDEAGEIQAEMICSTCGAEFCYYHSNAHVGQSCEAYTRKMAKLEREMADGVMADSKPCPRCGIMTSKVSGCNHMTCTERTCQCDWCWVCGKEIEGGANGVTAHYQQGTCRQFTDLEATPGPFLTCLTIIMCPVKLCFQLVFLLLTVLLIVILPIMFCLVGPCLRCNGLAVKMLAFIVSYWLYAFLTLFWMFFTLLFFSCCCLPCGADETHFLFLMIMPFMAIEPFRPFLGAYFREFDLDDWQEGESDDDDSEDSSDIHQQGE